MLQYNIFNYYGCEGVVVAVITISPVTSSILIVPSTTGWSTPPIVQETLDNSYPSTGAIVVVNGILTCLLSVVSLPSGIATNSIRIASSTVS